MTQLSSAPADAALQAAPGAREAAPAAPAAPPFRPPRLQPLPLVGALTGLFLAAMLGGLNSRLGSLGLDDLRGVFGFDYDTSTWITSFYSAGELVVMPFVAWLVAIFSLKRVHTVMLLAAMLLAVLLPFVQNIHLLMALRFVQGIACGGLIFMFMISIFLLMPAHIRMYGFGFYAMVATFAPNFGVWLTALWTDVLHGWEFLYWHSLLLGLPALLLMRSCLPMTPSNPQRMKNINLPGMLCIIPGCILVALALSQGVRLDWFHSAFVSWALPVGIMLIVIYAVTEWFHPNPFLELHVFVCHRNVWMVLFVLLGVLTVALAGSMLPVSYLGAVWDYRPLQTAPTGLIIALPQFLIGPVVAFLLYRTWIDARVIYISGLLLLVLGCYLGAHLDAEWIARQFNLAQFCLAAGLPTAIISTIYMASNNINVALGPSLGGAINTLRCIGTLAGTAILGQYTHVRQAFHYEWLRDKTLISPESAADYTGVLSREAFITATSDAYCLLGTLAAGLILIVLCLRYTPPPQAPGKS